MFSHFYFVSLAKLNPQTQIYIMKTFLKIAVLSAVLLVLAGITTSCEREHLPRPFEIGMYVQVFDDPSIDERWRVRIEVVDDQTLFIIYPVLNPESTWYPETRDKFRYEMLRGNRIKLMHMSIEEEVPIISHFRWINSRRFEIGLAPQFNAIFEKE